MNESSLGQVPSAASADTAVNATSAGNAEALGGQPASAYAAAEVEPVRVIGTAGQPDFGPGWGFNGTESEEVPGFYKDRGRVYLRGAIARTAGVNNLMFTLPLGYRPRLDEFFITYGGASTPAYVFVESDGEVRFNGGDEEYVGVGNISFRAEG